MTALPGPAAATLGSSPEVLACGPVETAGQLCQAVFRATGNRFLAASAEALVVRPFHILVIVLVALVVRGLLRRAIARLEQGLATGARGRLGPLGRGPAALLSLSAGERERRSQRAATVGSVLRSVTNLTVLGITAVLILGELGIDLAPIVASAGIVGVAVGFGAQNLVRDFLSGLFMLVEDQYGVGDVIDIGVAVGTVETVGLRVTRVRDVKGVLWHVRNGGISQVGNISQGWSRELLDIALDHGSDLAVARDVVQVTADALWEDDAFAGQVLERPSIWGVQEITRDGAVLRLAVKLAPATKDAVARELRERLAIALERGGVRLARSQREVLLRDPAVLAARTSTVARSDGR